LADDENGWNGHQRQRDEEISKSTHVGLASREKSGHGEDGGYLRELGGLNADDAEIIPAVSGGDPRRHEERPTSDTMAKPYST